MSQLIFNKRTAPSTPASNKVSVYVKPDGELYMKKDNGRHGRSDREVALRWQQWKAEYASGASVAQIANRWGMDRATVEYARKKGWKHKGDREIGGILVA